MYCTAALRTIFVAFGVSLCAAAGCNIDGLWAYRQTPPRGAERVTLISDDDAGARIDIAVADQREVDLVEAMAEHRIAYHHGLARLRDYYEKHGYAHKRSWVEYEQNGLKSVKPFRYLLDAEIPSGLLRPTDSIAEADSLYEKGLGLMTKGGHGVPAVYREDSMIEAAEVFRDLIERYPGSDKIDDAAFMCGEIHKEYLPGQELLAVRWYERVWTWDPHTVLPARFQAAVVYDYRLHDRDRALELYQSVVKEETTITSNVRFATRRIRALTADTRTARVTD